MALPLLPLLLLIGGGAVLLSSGGKKSSRSKAAPAGAPCDALQNLFDLGDPFGIWPGALEAAKREINLLPPTSIRQPIEISWQGVDSKGREIDWSVNINTDTPQIIKYANAAFRKLCGKSAPIEYVTVTREEYLRDIALHFSDEEEEIEQIKVTSGNVPDRWNAYVKIDSDALTQNEKEAFGWLCMAVTTVLHGSSWTSPYFPSTGLRSMSEGLASRYIRENSAPTINPSTVFSSPSVNMLQAPNKQFDVEMTRFYGDQLDVYLSPDTSTASSNAVWRELVYVMANNFAESIFGNDGGYSFGFSRIFRSITAFNRGPSPTDEDLYNDFHNPDGTDFTRATMKSSDPIFFIRYNDAAFERAVNIAMNMAPNIDNVAARLDELARAALLASVQFMYDEPVYEFQLFQAQEIFEQQLGDQLRFVYAADAQNRDIAEARALENEPFLMALLDRLKAVLVETLPQLGWGG